MREWNKLKISILKALKAKPTSTAKDVATSLQITEDAAEVALVRYFRQGLLSRQKRIGGRHKAPFIYWLSNRGSSRLSYLEKVQ